MHGNAEIGFLLPQFPVDDLDDLDDLDDSDPHPASGAHPGTAHWSHLVYAHRKTFVPEVLVIGLTFTNLIIIHPESDINSIEI